MYCYFIPSSKKYIPQRLSQYFWVMAGKGWMNKFVNIDQRWHSCYPTKAFYVSFLHPAVFKASHVFSWLVIRCFDVHFRFIIWFTKYGNFRIWTLTNYFSDYFSAIGNFQLKFNMDNSASDYFDNIVYILLHLQIFMLIN